MIFNYQVINGLYTFCRHAPSLVCRVILVQATKEALEATVNRMFFVFHFWQFIIIFFIFNNTWSKSIAPNEHYYGDTIIRCCLFCIDFECLWQKDSVFIPMDHWARKMEGASLADAGPSGSDARAWQWSHSEPLAAILLLIIKLDRSKKLTLAVQNAPHAVL